MKGVAYETILIIGVLVAVGFSLLQLRGIFYGQQLTGKEEVVYAFAKDLESVVDKAIATTGDAAFVYYPSIKQYYVVIKNNTVTITDRISNLSAYFSKYFTLIDNSFEDCEKIFVLKKEDKIFITCKCFELGEACSDSLQCCSSFCNKTSGKCEEMPVCPRERICPGAPGTEKIGGKDCCPADKPVCNKQHCCPADKPKWCETLIAGQSRCMNETEYNIECKKPCKNVYTLVFVANNAPNMDGYRERAQREINVFLQESPWRECPECIHIEILDVDCKQDFWNSWGFLDCVIRFYGHNFNMIHVVDFSGIANGYCLLGSPITICSNGIPLEVADYCPTHELGHCMGSLCDEYRQDYWIKEGCDLSGWSTYNLKQAGGCNDFNCGGTQTCCGTKLKPDDPTDRTVDIMGGGGGWKGACRTCGVYVYPIHFRDWNYQRFKNAIPLNNYCG